MRLLVVIIGLLCSSVLPARALDSGNDLLSSCESFLRAYRPAGEGFTLQATNGSVYECWGYINALQHLSSLSDNLSTGTPLTGACPPPSSTAVQLVRVVVSHLQKHPEQLHERAGTVAVAALRQAFPCR